MSESEEQFEWYDKLHLEEGIAAAADALEPPADEEEIWIATARRPFTGQKPQVVIAKTEAQAKAALLKFWRQTNRSRKRERSLHAKAHCILMGFDPIDFPEAFPGLGLPVRCWNDLRIFYGAYAYSVVLGEIFIFREVSHSGDTVTDAVEYLDRLDMEDQEPLW